MFLFLPLAQMHSCKKALDEWLLYSRPCTWGLGRSRRDFTPKRFTAWWQRQYASKQTNVYLYHTNIISNYNLKWVLWRKRIRLSWRSPGETGWGEVKNVICLHRISKSSPHDSSLSQHESRQVMWARSGKWWKSRIFNPQGLMGCLRACPVWGLMVF